MMLDPDLDALLTGRQVAKLAGVTQTTVNRWVEQGKLTPTWTAPGYRGAHYYHRDAVAAFLKRTTTQEAD